MHKKDILEELISARQEFMAAVDGLSPDQMLHPGAIGIWSIKDTIAHLVAWESELVTALNQAQNRKIPGIVRIDDIDEWNEERYHENARRLLDAVLADFEGVHRVLLEMVADYDERALLDNRRYPWMEGEPLSYLIEENAILHEREHAADIRTWREQAGV